VFPSAGVVGNTYVAEERAAQVTAYLKRIAPADDQPTAIDAAAVRGRLEPLPWAAPGDLDRAAQVLGEIDEHQFVAPPNARFVEAIILPNERPVVDIVNGTFDAPTAPFAHLGEGSARAAIEGAIPSIGRIELPGQLSIPYGGTGFIVGTDLLMTNRHVAELFATGIGREQLAFRTGQTAAIDFVRERGSTESHPFRVTRVVMIHPYWDMALLATEGLGGVSALRLSVQDPGDLQERDVAVIGYPALDPRNEIDLQNRILRGTFNVKRLQPGLLKARESIDSFGHTVSAVTHDSSTLGGNSGSAVIDADTGTVVGLHFAGIYLKANYAVPTRELALDRRVVDAGVNFEAEVADTGSTPWDRFWNEADPRGAEVATGAVAAAPVGIAPLSWTFPLEVTIQIRGAAAAATAAVGASPAAVESLAEPFRDDDFSGRRGYDEHFLGIDVPLPRVRDESVVSRLDDGSYLLPYEHFSLVQHKLRRLALFTAANVDALPARKQPESGRDYTRKGLTGLGENDQEKWFTDPRIPVLHQLPDRFFTKDRKAFDKGHIVRREDVTWGDTYDEVRRANGDTFHVTNCSPQVSQFNRSNLKGIWGELENLVLTQAKAERYCVLAGPVLRTDDPLFRGVDDQGDIRVAIPRRFWKIVVARAGDELQTFAFILEQDLTDTPLEFAVDALWHSRMIALPELDRLTELIDFPPELHDSDQIDAAAGEAIRAHPGLERFE
jgi:endonuclease G